MGQPTTATGGALASQPPLRVTTDTPEYCASLAGRIDREQQTQPILSYADEVTSLTVEGRRMCHSGLVVGGIARLRRAWMLLHPDR